MWVPDDWTLGKIIKSRKMIRKRLFFSNLKGRKKWIWERITTPELWAKAFCIEETFFIRLLIQVVPFCVYCPIFPWNDHHRFTCINIYQYNRIAMNSLNIGWKYWELSQLISNWGWVQIEVITIFNSSLGNWFWLLRRRGISLTHYTERG